MALTLPNPRAKPLSSLMFYLVVFAMLSSFAVAADFCSKLEALHVPVERPLTQGYGSTFQGYWSAACGDLRPHCVVSPKNALEMSQVVKELQGSDELFAVKSGGFNPNLGFSSIDNGLLISTQKLDQVVYNPADQTATVGPGLSFEAAQKKLAGTGRAIVGARMGGVGVGGLMVSSGWSYLSNQYGWATNNVLNYEVVLANGTIVNANKDEHPDLFSALKGGSSNFGIVTSIKVQTQPQNHKVWGGSWTFPSHVHNAQILGAIRDFAEYNHDDKAAIIPTTAYTPQVKSWTFFVFYDAPKPPKGVFDNFTAYNHIDDTKTWDSYHELLKYMDIGILKDQRYTISTETLPLPNAAVGAQVLSKIHQHWYNISDTVIDVPGNHLVIGPYPFVATNCPELQAARWYYLLLTLNFSYHNKTDDGTIDRANKGLFRGYKDIIDDFVDDKVLPDVHRPLFMGEASYAQDPWGRLDSGSTDRAREVQDRYDPAGFFQRRTSGGFRLN